MINVSIVGASGYAGGELLRILLSHKKVNIRQVTSQRFNNQPVTLVHPNLRGKTELFFSSIDSLAKCDLIFICLPNSKSMHFIDKLALLADRIIDLGADFRLHDPKQFTHWYGIQRINEQFSKHFVYGLCELNRNKIKKAKFVSCGGCEATSVILALYPLVVGKIITGDTIIADIKIGSSASGNKFSPSSHHPERDGVLRSYKPTNHRHQAEVNQELGIDVQISATAVPLVRGILATIHARIKSGLTEKNIWQSYSKVYQKEPFIRIIKEKQGLYRYPEPKILWGTNFCDIGFEKANDSNRLVVICAIDNLVKGTAGQAVQVLNVMYGFAESTALDFSGLHPI